MDGTFSSAPALFEQIFVIRAHLGESAVRRALKKTSQAGNQGPTGTTKKPMRRLQRWTQDFGADAAWRRSQHSSLLVT